jgi:hypothetical protein
MKIRFVTPESLGELTVENVGAITEKSILLS